VGWFLTLKQLYILAFVACVACIYSYIGDICLFTLMATLGTKTLFWRWALDNVKIWNENYTIFKSTYRHIYIIRGALSRCKKKELYSMLNRDCCIIIRCTQVESSIHTFFDAAKRRKLTSLQFAGNKRAQNCWGLFGNSSVSINQKQIYTADCMLRGWSRAWITNWITVVAVTQFRPTLH
jgi:hypothetical protein